jgi:cupin 2 domain-containing protein
VAEEILTSTIKASLTVFTVLTVCRRDSIMGNIFSPLPENPRKEIVEELVRRGDVRIERIVSKGHTSPDDGWYDQIENEWVIVLEGSGRILFENGPEVRLKKGDYINIPAHSRHKVTWTDPDNATVWLAVFYK